MARAIRTLDLWALFGQKVEKVWRCKSGVTDVFGECLACPADQGEACQRYRVEAARPVDIKKEQDL